ncbi:nucleotidyltransferase family protein [Acidaminobacter sp. JC074]|uniref:nucleotidyltransferase family protein n=1 Tax=Acidaminobacter sp. JC074 TaxID=2530199 RepID=UPI001F0E92BB|nr:nucleotidyltransferase family protein [Acidaminobacter sp. JC074]MCH4887801.1 nucleotidyltransferase family protein [Acidaminobacter sp. JC074]
MKVDGIILAAGLSSRMVDNKLLLAFRESFIIRHIVMVLLESNLDRLVIVTGRDEDKVKHTLEGLPVEFVHNKDYKTGQSSSVSLGVKHLKDSQAIMFFMGDQPLIKAEIINDMIGSFLISDKSILVPYYHEKRGNPVIFQSKWFDKLMDLSGDYGGRYIIKAHPEELEKYIIKEKHFFLDVDTKENYAFLQALEKSSD